MVKYTHKQKQKYIIKQRASSGNRDENETIKGQ